MTTSAHYGHNGFTARVRERTGIEPTRLQVRLMEASATIHPTVADSGWRQFTDTDIDAACAWLVAHSTRRRA